MSLAALVRAWRSRALLSQEELAERAGLSVGTVRGIEAGRIRRPRTGSVRRLADALALVDHDRETLLAVIGGPDRVGTGVPRPAGPVPAPLPAAVTGFVGRVRALGLLDETLAAGDGSSPGPVVISAIDGTAGVGKTALAVHWGHRVAGRFPDGQLYVNLRGYDPEQPVPPGAALVRLLGALGVPGRDIPVDLEERAARYRTEVAGRRMLVVLDNAATAEQVRPLLPGTGSCAVVVTSRDRLAGLVAVHGARRIDLDLLPLDEAIALLRALIGTRVDAEPEAAVALAEQCARLPLALRVAAELVASRPAALLAELVSELGDQQRRLDLLDAGGDPRGAVTTVFSWSVRHLPSADARIFRVLGLHPGPDFDAYAVAALADLTHAQAARGLDLLARAHLVHPAGDGRYGMHDLLRAYAVRLSTMEESKMDRRRAVGRLLDYYLATAADAMDPLYPAEAERRPRVPPPGTPTPAVADPDNAHRWLDTERTCLVAVATFAARHGWPAHAIDLSAVLYRYLVGGHSHDALIVHGAAADAAGQSGDEAGRARALLGLGAANFHLSRYVQARDQYEEALSIYQRSRDRTGEARALNNLAAIELRLGDNELAADRHEQALALYRQVGDRTGEARALNGLGVVEQLLGRYELGAEHHELALELIRASGNRTDEGLALILLSAAEWRLGRLAPAAEHCRQALALFRQAGDPQGEARALDGLGVVHTSLGELDRATECHTDALALFRANGDLSGQTWALNGLGEAACAAGKPAEAITWHTAALDIAAGIGERDQHARAHAGLGHAHRALGGLPRARSHYEQALTLYREHGLSGADDMRAVLEQLSP